ncbi:MAG TPA: type I 3-dehydroquinate dehydratase [Planctomycetia bacterium]|nr:type I 3-dehydroquinate dehydratase [Planctomycetia bacterium]
MASICGIVARRRHSKILEEMALGKSLGLGLLEIRLDFLSRDIRFKQILGARPCPLIATIRRKKDGGQWYGEEDRRQALLRLAIAEGFDYVDIEFDAAHDVKRYGSTKRIVSFHDMAGFPADIEALHGEMIQRDADIVKLAVRAEKASDNAKVLALLAKTSFPTIAICMSEWGFPSRILGAKLGSPFTYAALNPLRIVAPGLPTVADLRDVYHYESIDAATEIYGVIGDPIAQSLSPLVHNASFRRLGLNKAYVPFRVTSADLEAFLKGIEVVRPRGLSVTIPHKRAMLQFGIVADDLVRRAKSANTRLKTDGGWTLHNTDGSAGVESLLSVTPEDPETGFRSVADRQVLILGAGGVACSIAHALKDAGAFVTVTSRRPEEGKSLAAQINCRFLEWHERYRELFEVLVNCTPVGMHPDVQATPFHQGTLREGMVVMDTVYHPENTLLVREARERGCLVATGVEMFVRQAEAQFRLFTGRSAPPDLMRELVREELSPARRMLREDRLAREAQPEKA